MRKKVEIYTDGACSGNPGKGGWASILLYNGHEKIISGGLEHTTNNRMEMFAVLAALKQLKEPCLVDVYSDSAYCVDAVSKGWLDVWQKNNWRTKSNDDVKNIDIWKALLIELSRHTVTFIKVKGHSDNLHNNRCDEIARTEIKKLS